MNLAAMSTTRLIAITGFVVLMGSLPVRAQLDLNGDWLETQQNIVAENCALNIVQTGTDLQVQQDCILGPDASATGTIDLITSTFTAAGSCAFGPSGGYIFNIEGTVAADSTISGVQYCTGAAGLPLLYTATRCGNGVIDSGEDCEAPAGCCSNCRFTVGAACEPQACVTGTCDAAGVCMAGAPTDSGTACEADGDNCTVEQCDGAGSCEANAVVPCDDVCATCDASHTCIGQPRELTRYGNLPGGCWRPTLARSKTTIKNGTPGSLTWRLGREDRDMSFGDPTATTDYHLCVYYRSDFGETWYPLTSARADAGASWHPISGGFRFKDPTAAGGIEKLRLRSPTGKGTKIVVGASGPALPLPSDFTTLGLEPQGQLQVEIRRLDDGQCWGAEFSVEYGMSVNTTLIRGRNGG